MKGLPDSEIYEQELMYWPYRDSLKFVLNYLCEHAPRNGTLLDVMCGPGYLLGKISERRKDLSLMGLDLDERYVAFAREKYPHINFEQGDLLSWRSQELSDVVICTGAVHHILYAQQIQAIMKMSALVRPPSFVLISDCYIDDYASESERKVAAAKLGSEYLRETIQNGAPDQVVQECINILSNDVMMVEFKTSIKKRLPLLEKVFDNVETFKVWPNMESEYGDYISICRQSKVEF